MEKFAPFPEPMAGRVRIIGPNQQFLDVTNAIASLLRIRESRRASWGDGRGGVHQQTRAACERIKAC